MPYVNKPRPYKHEWQMQKARNEKPERAMREQARYTLDKKGVDRTGKDISHKVALSKGGTNADGYRLESPSTNRARNYMKKAK